MLLGARQRCQPAALRQGVSVDGRAHARVHQHVAEVTHQAVAEIDGAAGHTPQRQAERHAGRGALHAQAHGFEGLGGQRQLAAEHFQSQAGIAESAPGRVADPECIARAGAGAQQSLADRHRTEHRDADVEWPRGGVAPHQLQGVFIGQREQAACETFEEALINARQRQRQREGHRLGPAGGQIRQVHGQRLVAQAVGGHGGQKVASLDQHVARHRHLAARRQRRQQRAVVTHPERGARRRPREVARDQVELPQRAHQAFSSQWKRCKTRCITGLNTNAAVAMKTRPAYRA